MERNRGFAGILLGAALSLGAASGCQSDKNEGAAQAQPPAAAEGQEVTAAEPVGPEPGRDGTLRRREGRSARRASIIEKYDQNGDGQLDDTERGAMQRARAAQMIERHDTDGDGSLSRAELNAVRGPSRRMLGGGADANGDGAVSAAELEASLAARGRDRRAPPAGGGGGSEEGENATQLR